ncbi:ATP-binding protein [Allosalinactinospora lopnorensis]|uniref:ATP-binding protein n=1 Tax=Allosalinactinospora lopnorensis TaxID=1352348 RepID=UPI000623DBE8|nr:ATP-binding protein [Allosalinactinospora lopnorensis]
MALDEHRGSVACGAGTGLDYRRLFHAVPSPCAVLTPDFTIVDVNDAYMRVSGRDREDLIGRYVFEAFPDNPADPTADGTRNLGRSLRTVLATGEADAMALQRYDIPIGPDGHFEERYWSPLNTPVLDENGTVTHIIHRVENVTDFVRMRSAGREQQQAAAEQQMRADRMESDLFIRGREVQEANQKLRRSNEALATAGAELRRQQRAKDDFIATLSHELRNPIAALRAASELLALDSPEGHPALPVLERQISVMVRMIDDLLDATRALTGRLELHSARLDLCSVTATAVEDMRPEYVQAQRRLRLSMAPGPLPVEGDRVRLTQMLGNLLSNGRKYTRPGGTVVVGLGSEDEHAVLTVRDDGVGFAPEATEALFEAFGRPSQRPGVDAGGLGLGLHIVRGIAEQHGGSVRAHSDGEGAGACFRILLPLSASAPGPSGPASPPAWPHPRPALRVLVIEDNTDLAATYQTLLERHGDSVTVARTGGEGLTAAQEQTFDLILSDLALPDISGHEVARRLRRTLEDGHTRLVAVSGFSQDSDRDESVRSGFDAHMAKPLDSAVLNQMLARWASE